MAAAPRGLIQLFPFNTAKESLEERPGFTPACWRFHSVISWRKSPVAVRLVIASWAASEMGTESWARSTAFSIWVYRVVMGPGVPEELHIGNILLQFSGTNDGVGGHQMGDKSKVVRVMKFVVGRRRAATYWGQGLQWFGT
jgi:hypothetical protein